MIKINQMSQPKIALIKPYFDMIDAVHGKEAGRKKKEIPDPKLSSSRFMLFVIVYDFKRNKRCRNY